MTQEKFISGMMLQVFCSRYFICFCIFCTFAFLNFQCIPNAWKSAAYLSTYYVSVWTSYKTEIPKKHFRYYVMYFIYFFVYCVHSLHFRILEFLTKMHRNLQSARLSITFRYQRDMKSGYPIKIRRTLHRGSYVIANTRRMYVCCLVRTRRIAVRLHHDAHRFEPRWNHAEM